MATKKRSGRQAHSGKYRVKNPARYKGDADKVTYRSSWEKAVFIWLDKHPKVRCWSSEEVVIPYICATDKKPHRYFMDVYIEWADDTNRIDIVEIKPNKQTKPPKKRGRPKAKYLEEAMVYMKNQSKWAAAKKYATERGWNFSVWDENFLKQTRIMKW
jgi:hypothetical protein